MKAIRVHQHGDPEVMKLEEVPDLKAGAGEVVVRARAIGVNPVDTYIRAGNYGPFKSTYTPGKDAAGEVIDLAGRLRALGPQMQQLCDLLATCWANGGKLLVCGNGGSCADAMHLAEELVVRFQKNRRAFAAVALADPTVLTCCANDFGYEMVFARQVEALGRPGDVLLVLTTSGNSPNILKAIDAARASGLRTVGFLGGDGGKARGECEIELIIPARAAHRVQEGHKILYHTLCEWVDGRFAAGVS